MSMHVLSLESRRGDDMRRLIENAGATATVAPSMQEVPLDEESRALAFATELLAGKIDVCVFMTGVGTTTLFDAIKPHHDFSQIQTALAKCTVIARGPKPSKVLREHDVEIHLRAPDPNTWREILSAAADTDFSFNAKTVAVQEYGIPNEEFYSELKQRGAEVVPVTVYRWKLPDDTQPLKNAVEQTIAGAFDMIMFTSANQVRNLLTVAQDQADAWLNAANQSCIASIGPTCSEALQQVGLTPHFEASPPKMGRLVRGAIDFLRNDNSKNNRRVTRTDSRNGDPSA